MADLNHVIEIGRITRDIGERDFAFTIGGTARLNMSIAVNRNEKRNGAWQDKVSYFDVTVWGKTAENIKSYLHKGKQIAIDGYLDQQRWEKDGVKYSKVCIIANNVQLLGGNENGQQRAPQAQQPAGDYQSAGSGDDHLTYEVSSQVKAGDYQSAGSGDDFPEDIPF